MSSAEFDLEKYHDEIASGFALSLTKKRRTRKSGRATAPERRDKVVMSSPIEWWRRG